MIAKKFKFRKIICFLTFLKKIQYNCKVPLSQGIRKFYNFGDINLVFPFLKVTQNPREPINRKDI